jgi:hypothetical protein
MVKENSTRSSEKSGLLKKDRYSYSSLNASWPGLFQTQNPFEFNQRSDYTVCSRCDAFGKAKNSKIFSSFIKQQFIYKQKIKILLDNDEVPGNTSTKS